jgi:hypothetical protein
VVLYAFLGKLSDAITRFLERRLLRWQVRQSSETYFDKVTFEKNGQLW